MSRYLFRDARAVFVEAAFDADAATPLVPRPLALDRTRAARFFAATYPRFGKAPGFCESGMYLPVRYLAINGYYCPWMLVDDARSRHLGRKYLALPKELGELSWEESDAAVAARVTDGVTEARLDAVLGGRPAPGRAFSFPSFGLRRTSPVLPALLVLYGVRERIARAESCEVVLATKGVLAGVALRPISAAYLRFDFGGDGTWPVPVGATYVNRARGVSP